MKENDEVRLTVEKEKYARKGFHKGMTGEICDPRKIDGEWLVSFWNNDVVDYIEVKEEDLEVIWEAPEYKVGTTVLLFRNKECYETHGITEYMFGVICEQGEDEEHWGVRFTMPDGTDKIVSVDYYDMFPLRDDAVEAWKKEVEEELKRRRNGGK